MSALELAMASRAGTPGIAMMERSAGRLLEVGIAVSDLAAARCRLRGIFGGPASDVIAEDHFAMRFSMCRIGGTDFELMESDGPSGVIGKFIARRGQGLHHIAFQVEDARAAMARFRACDVPPLSTEPVLLDNIKAFFLPPRLLGGVLFEFIENLHTWVEGVPLPAPGGNPPGPDAPHGSVQVAGFGVMVPDIRAAAAAFAAVLGASNSDIYVDPQLGAEVCCSRLANVEFKLIAASEGHIRSPLLAPRGSGLHYVRLRVDDLEQLARHLLQRGVRFMAAITARRGQRQSVFTHPDSLNGVMFELFQSP